MVLIREREQKEKEGGKNTPKGGVTSDSDLQPSSLPLKPSTELQAMSYVYFSPRLTNPEVSGRSKYKSTME